MFLTFLLNLAQEHFGTKKLRQKWRLTVKLYQA